MRAAPPSTAPPDGRSGSIRLAHPGGAAIIRRHVAFRSLPSRPRHSSALCRTLDTRDDGFRIVARREGDGVRLLTKQRNYYASRYSLIVGAQSICLVVDIL